MTTNNKALDEAIYAIEAEALMLGHSVTHMAPTISILQCAREGLRDAVTSAEWLAVDEVRRVPTVEVLVHLRAGRDLTLVRGVARTIERNTTDRARHGLNGGDARGHQSDRRAANDREHELEERTDA